MEWRKRRKIHQFIAERIDARVRQWRFSPGMVDGVAKPTRTHQYLTFKASAGEDEPMLTQEDPLTGA